MGTILRSSKYIRCLNVLTRRTVVGHDNANLISKYLALQTRCTNSYLTKSYATIPAVQRNDTYANFDRYIAKLDENVQRYGRVFRGEIEDTLSKVRDAGYISSLDGLLLIRCCGELLVDCIPSGRNQIVQEVWNTLVTLKIPMDVSHFNALLRVYLENGYEFSPVDILTEMKDKNIEPNRVTYQRLILYYCKKGDIEGATKILEFMREKGLPLNESVFTALITGHSEANNMEGANNILNVMKDAGVDPCSSTYTALLSAYAKRGDAESIKRIVSECEKSEMYLHDKEFFEVIQVLATHGHNDVIDEVLSMMPRSSNYNYDAFHAILKVVDVGNVDVALKILPTMKKRRIVEAESDETENENGTFLIRKLVNSKFPVETIIYTCEQLEKQGQHARPFFVAVERSLLNGDTTLSIPLLKAWKERGGNIREHYVWPILVSHGKASNFQGIQDVLKVTVEDLKVPLGIETITDFVLPYTLGRWDDVVATLKEYRIPHKTIVNSIARKMLLDNKIRKTAMFMTNYSSIYEADLLDRALVDALKITDDTRSCAIILQHLHNSALKRPKEETSKEASPEESGNFHNETVIDKVLRQIVTSFPVRKYPVVNELLGCLVEGGMSISPEIGEQIRQYFQDNLTPEINEKIDKLTSGTLVPVSLTDGLPADETGTINDASDTIHVGSQFSIKRQQLSSALAAQDTVALKSLTEELESKNFKFTPAIYAQMVDVFCETGDMESADMWLKKFKSEHPTIGLDLQKSTNYAALLIKNNRFDDAMQYILDSPRKDAPSLGPGLRKLVKNLLEVAAQTGNAEKTNELLEALVASQYTVIDNYVVGSLVKVHLVNNDIEGALNAFENACQKYRCTPLKNELAKRLIDAEDAISLQRLTDLSTQVHGESNSLVDLVLSFIECGRLRQARKILETPGLRLRGAKFRTAAARYVEDNKPEFLEQFFDLTKGLVVLDRQELYDILLDTYCKRNDWQRGLNLWTEMQDENTQPSLTFLNTLAELLKRNGKPIPFSRSEQMPTQSAFSLNYVNDFQKAMECGDLDRAEKIIMKAPTNDVDFSTVTSTLIEQLLEQRKDIDKAYDLAVMLIAKLSRLPRASALKALWNSLIENEQYDKLANFTSILSENTKRKLRFFKYLSRAEFKKLGVSKFLSNFEAQLTDSKKDNFALVKNKLHFTTLLDEIKKDPSCLKQITRIAERLSSQQIHLPMNVLWCYYFEQNKPEAEEIWSKHLAHTSWIIFSQLLQIGRDTNNIDVVERLHQKLRNNVAVSANAKATTLSSLIEAYNKEGRYDDALKILQDTSAEVVDLLKTQNFMCIRELRKNLEASGKSLPPNFDSRP